MGYDGSLSFDTKIDSSGFQKSANELTGLVKGLGVFEVLKKGAQLVADSFDRAMGRIDTMEQFKRVMDAMTGSTKATAEALQKTTDIVTGTAYGLDVAARSVQNFVARGMEVDSATETVERWGDAVAFYGDGTNATFASVTDALSKMQTKGNVTMEHMEMLLNAGIPAIELYADAMGIGTDQVTDAMSKGALSAEDFIDTLNKAFADGTKGFPALTGAAKKAGASWVGTFDNMRAAVTRGVQSILNAVDDTLRALKGTDMRDMISKFGKAFENALKTAAKAIPPLIKGLDLLSPVLVGLVVGVETYTIAVKAAAATQAIWNAVTTATLNPVALVIAGAAAAAAGIVLLNEKLEQGSTVIDYWNERNEESVAAMDEMRQKTVALQKAREDSLSADFAQIDNTERLAQELYSLVDANGFVQDANRARVDFILGELNNAYGTEFEMVDGIIQEYGKLQGTITELFAAKRANTLLESWSEEYTNAVTNMGKMRTVVSEHRTNLDTMQADMDEMLKKYPNALKDLVAAQQESGANLTSVQGDMVAKYGGQYYDMLTDLQTAIATEQQLYDEANVALKNSYDIRDSYEQASIEARNENYVAVSSLLDAEKLAYTEEAAAIGLSEEQKTQTLAQAYANRLAYYAQYAEELKNGMKSHSAEELETIRADAEKAQEAYLAASGAKVDAQIQGIDGKTLDLQASFDRLSAAGIESLNNSLEPYALAGAQVPQAAASGMQNSTAVQDASAQMVTNGKLAQVAAIAGGGFTESGAQMAQQTADGVQTSTSMQDASAQMVTDTKAKTDTSIAASNFTESGSQIAKNTADGICNSTAPATAAQNSISAAKNAADGQVSACNFPSVGMHIANGIAQGVASGTGAICAAVQGAVNAALSTAKSAAQINSPSRLFRRVIGGGIMEGWAQGIERGEPLVTSSLESAFDTMKVAMGTQMASHDLIQQISSLQPGVFSPDAQRTFSSFSPRTIASASPENSNSAIASALSGLKRNTEIPVTVNIDGREVYKAVKRVEESFGYDVGGMQYAW